MTQTASNGNTALHWAAFHGLADMIEVLLQKGAVLDAPDDNELAIPSPALLCAICLFPASASAGFPNVL